MGDHDEFCKRVKANINVNLKRKLPIEFRLERESKKLKVSNHNRWTINMLLVERLKQKNSTIIKLESELVRYKMIVKKLMYTNTRCALEYIKGV